MEERSSKPTSFFIEIRYQQHQTWQGTITWLEMKKKVNFRSALELIRLMDSALGPDGSRNFQEREPRMNGGNAAVIGK